MCKPVWIAVMLLIAGLAIAAPTSVSAGPQATHLPGPSDAHLTACHHFENRARFKPRTGPVEFVTLMAEACRAALHALTRPEPRMHATAQAYLDRLAVLTDTIGQMNAERVFGDQAVRRRTVTGNRHLTPMTRVSDAGESLIAHRMGLMTAFDDWIYSGGEVTLAQY